MHSTQLPRLDLNLLIALDALLEEESVTEAARRLHLSSPAMSRTLGRIRKALGDQVLVRSGRVMVPTPRALALRGEVRELLERAQALFRPPAEPDPATLERTFTLLADDALLTAFGMPLLALLGERAPGVTLRLLPEGPENSRALRSTRVDLEIGVPGETAPETRVAPLFTDENIGVARRDHPLFSGEITPGRYAAADHVTASRRGRLHGPIDEALAGLGLRRRVVASLPTHSAALLVAAGSDLVARTGRRLAGPVIERLGLRTFEIPLPLPPLPVAQSWHPRFDGDPAHRWLRATVREVASGLRPGA
ncbi:LysR family transcriptional regulator [Streptomyces hoynatensis]|uniref:LysR family transcriptional regulator n=1 Tax=Streptomyces hoynatensis TaxID=1141874 RepID=A0A3A9YNT2_9ACTN|nr:LysR family transcriptional regulator [Streptomyces hoynatensis]RKN37064.1 LysR family transcriptional regulator [Streptomyces hoynatensis]